MLLRSAKAAAFGGSQKRQKSAFGRLMLFSTAAEGGSQRRSLWLRLWLSPSAAVEKGTVERETVHKEKSSDLIAKKATNARFDVDSITPDA